MLMLIAPFFILHKYPIEGVIIRAEEFGLGTPFQYSFDNDSITKLKSKEPSNLSNLLYITDNTDLSEVWGV